MAGRILPTVASMLEGLPSELVMEAAVEILQAIRRLGKGEAKQRVEEIVSREIDAQSFDKLYVAATAHASEAPPQGEELPGESRSADVLDAIAARVAKLGAEKWRLSEDLRVPRGSVKRIFKDRVEIGTPPVGGAGTEARERDLVRIKDLGKGFERIFEGIEHFNAIQSAVFRPLFYSRENVLVCAPTGSGKTELAMVAILREVAERGAGARAVYIAPMKALVREIRDRIKKAFSEYEVAEVSGDSSISKRDLYGTHILVATPEKFDVLTRKGFCAFHVVVIDEIHILNEERGHVVEGIVARLRSRGRPGGEARIIALSATLPNYREVGAFIGASREHVFHFGGEARPVPLSYEVVGVSGSAGGGRGRYRTYNEVMSQKIEELLPSRTIVFVSSRPETARSAEFILGKVRQEIIPSERAMRLERALASLSNGLLGCEGAELEERIRGIIKALGDGAPAEASQGSGAPSKAAAYLARGVGVHHAGLPLPLRRLTEELFRAGEIKVIVSTATLAWGINLPIDNVIIKGTSIYRPAQSGWSEYSLIDIVQMAGRAGRPGGRLDAGRAIVVTEEANVVPYTRLVTCQLPIESHFASELHNHLSSEIASGLASEEEAASWYRKSFLFVRVGSNPELFPGKAFDEEAHTSAVVSAAVGRLSSLGAIRASEGRYAPTRLGQLANEFYVSVDNAKMFRDLVEAAASLGEPLNESELLHIASLSSEYGRMRVLVEERHELRRLAGAVPYPPVTEENIAHTAIHRLAQKLGGPSRRRILAGNPKVSVLFQAHVSGIPVSSFTLCSDQAYIASNIARSLWVILFISMEFLGSTCRAVHNLCRAAGTGEWKCRGALGHVDPKIKSSLVRRGLGIEDTPLMSAKERRAVESERARMAQFAVDYRLALQFARSAEAGPSVLHLNIERLDANSPARRPFLLMLLNEDGSRVVHHEVVKMRGREKKRVAVPLGPEELGNIDAPIYWNVFIEDLNAFGLVSRKEVRIMLSPY